MKKIYLFALSLFVGGIMCLVVFSSIGSYVAEDGMLVEEFWLAPIGFLLALFGVVMGMGASAWALRHKPEKVDMWMFGLSFGMALVALAYFTASYSHITSTTEEENLVPNSDEAVDVSVVYSDGENSVRATFSTTEQTVSFTHPEVGTHILPVAVSASGARYANSDESVVFWEHQDEVTIMKDGEEIFRGRLKADAETALTELEARAIAEQACIKGGEALSLGAYNPNSKTWWFDANLNAVREGCNPACVVSEETKTAEINWRCTGLTPPKNPGVSE
jgi:membrane-bound inhibitor of C-type lysozyme